jgi:hypothetical protein
LNNTTNTFKLNFDLTGFSAADGDDDVIDATIDCMIAL